VKSYRVEKNVAAVENCRNIGKKDMILNDFLPDISIDPETYQVMVDGKHITCDPATTLPLTQLYQLF
jgi:urease subunit alpha